MNNIELFKELKYGLMIHFGLYSLLGGYYKGIKGPKYAEWIQADRQISVKEMKRLAEVFNPIYFDADEICEFAQKCGMKYIVITTKHHEGFALFKSDADKFNVCDSTPFKRDIIGELAESCKKHGLKLGFYYSQCIDWNEKDGGGYTLDSADAAGVSWENSWDFPDKTEKDYSRVFYSKILPQIEELMTNYGEVFLAWFDMPLDSTIEHSRIIYDTVKRLQPDCLINSRLGNGVFDYVTLGDYEIPDEIPTTFSSDNNSICGFKKSPYGLYESICSLNCSWGYSAVADEWMSPEELAAHRLKLEKLGVNFMVNIGPDWLGRIPYQAQTILLKAAEKYKAMKNDSSH